METYKLGETPRIRLVTAHRTSNGSLVTALGGGESIAYSVKDSAGTQILVGSTTGGQVTHDGGGTWGATLTGLPVGWAYIRWTALVNEGETIWDDALYVSP